MKPKTPEHAHLGPSPRYFRENRPLTSRQRTIQVAAKVVLLLIAGMMGLILAAMATTAAKGDWTVANFDGSRPPTILCSRNWITVAVEIPEPDRVRPIAYSYGPSPQYQNTGSWLSTPQDVDPTHAVLVLTIARPHAATYITISEVDGTVLWEGWAGVPPQSHRRTGAK